MQKMNKYDLIADMNWTDLTLILSGGLSHQNIVKFIGASVTPKAFFLIYEHCECGDLRINVNHQAAQNLNIGGDDSDAPFETEENERTLHVVTLAFLAPETLFILVMLKGSILKPKKRKMSVVWFVFLFE